MIIVIIYLCLFPVENTESSRSWLFILCHVPFAINILTPFIWLFDLKGLKEATEFKSTGKSFLKVEKNF